MLSKYKDELLKEKIDDMDQLDRIELRQMVTRHEGIKSDSGSLIIAMIFTVGAYILIPSLKFLYNNGLDYSANIHVISSLLFFGLLFLMFSVIENCMSSKRRNQSAEAIDEFIRENAV